MKRALYHLRKKPRYWLKIFLGSVLRGTVWGLTAPYRAARDKLFDSDLTKFLPTLIYFGIPFLFSLAVYGIFYLFVPLHSIIPRLTEPAPLLIVLICVHAALIVIAIVCTAKFAMPLFYMRRVGVHEAEVIETGRVTTFEGEPGAGKSLTMTYDSVILANHSEREQRFTYLLQKGKEKNPALKPFKNMDDFWRYCAVRDGVEAFAKLPDTIPYLYSNYPIWQGKKRSCNITLKHFLQRERVAEGAVIAQDESADIVSNTRSKAKVDSDTWKENEIINEFVSKERHFGDWYMTFSEQDAGENFIGIRRVVKCNRYMESLRKVCLPNFLINRFEKLKSKVLRRDNCTHKHFKKAMRLKRLITKIGFFRIEYSDRGNSQKSKRKTGEGYFVLPINLPCSYETRAYFYDYAPMNKPLKLQPHTSMYVT